jgi:putative ABC transport system substrate-binding protein
MFYSTDRAEHRAGACAAKILAGAKPADLPIEQARKFTCVTNLKTSKVLGLPAP